MRNIQERPNVRPVVLLLGTFLKIVSKMRFLIVSFVFINPPVQKRRSYDSLSSYTIHIFIIKQTWY